MTSDGAGFQPYSRWFSHKSCAAGHLGCSPLGLQLPEGVKFRRTLSLDPSPLTLCTTSLCLMGRSKSSETKQRMCRKGVDCLVVPREE